MLKKLLKYKLITGIVLALILTGGYFGYKNFVKKVGKTRYNLAAVEKGTIIVAVSGSGQVLASEQIDIKSKVNGEIESVYTQKGNEVKTGTLIAKLNERDFKKAVKEAEISLETAKLELEELLSSPDELTLLQAENSLIQTKESKQKAEDNLLKAYEDGFNNVANAFLELPDIMTGLNSLLFSSNFVSSQQNIDYYADAVKSFDEKVLQYKTDAYNKYQIARKSYEQNFQNYKVASRFSEKTIIDSLINETYENVKNVAEAIKSANNLIQFYQDKLTERNLPIQNLSDSHLSTLSNYTGKTNSHLSSLLSAQRSIKDYKETIINARRTIEEKELSLTKLKSGPDELDIRAKKIAIQQKEDALNAAKENLTNCYIHAALSGLITDVKVKKGDSVSVGTVLASIISKQKIVEVSLNEVDVAKVKIGQKSTLTFDALPEVTITGKVIEIDPVGSVSQGVVSYRVKISLDSEDERIKPSMSVTADIIVDTKSDVLVVPNSAVKSQTGIYYADLVEIPEEKKQEYLNNLSGIILTSLPKRQIIEVGISNDSLTEISSGLKEGDIVVFSIINPVTQTNKNQGSQQLQIPGMGRQIRIR